MANNSTGKWVQRAATTGGGRTYRGQMPVNWYASLAIIIVVGLSLVVLSRYQLTHRSATSSGTPTTSQKWYAALGTDICGTLQPNLAASTAAEKAKTGIVANGNGVVTIAPKNSADSGANATLGRFVSNYRGLELSDSTLKYPGHSTLTNGNVCPKGSPDAGKPGVVIVYSWPNFTAKHGSESSGDPQDLPFQNGQLITMAFVPATATIPKPPASVITNLINADEAGPTTTPTTAPVATPATTPTPPTTAAHTTTSTTSGGAKG